MIKTARQLKDLIRNLSKDKSADAQILMRNYMMERFLERISLSEYRDKFILKGGMLVAAMVGDHIILAAHPAGLLNVLILGEKKLGVGDPAVALPARNQPAAVRLLRIFGVVDDVADGLSHRAAFAGVQGHQARGCHGCSPP